MPDVITGPGWYETRDGGRVEIVVKVRGEFWAGYIKGHQDHQLKTWKADGSYSLYGLSLNDLIAPWTDPEETVCVAVYRCGVRLLPEIIDPEDDVTAGEVGRAIVKLKGGA